MGEYNLFDHYQLMEDQNIVISFKGEISNRTLISLGELLKKLFKGKDKRTQVTKRIFAIFIEFAQNILLYSANKVEVDGKLRGSGIIVVEKHLNHYIIKSGNVVLKNQVHNLKQRIADINSMNKDQLKHFFNNQLKASVKEGQAGGRVGLILIARKSKNPIAFIENSIDDQYAFVELSTRINEEE